MDFMADVKRYGYQHALSMERMDKGKRYNYLSEFDIKPDHPAFVSVEKKGEFLWIVTTKGEASEELKGVFDLIPFDE